MEAFSASRRGMDFDTVFWEKEVSPFRDCLDPVDFFLIL